MEQWQIGAVTVTKIVDMELRGGLEAAFPTLTPEAVAPFKWLQPHYVDEAGRLSMSIHALVVDTGTRRILVDTCLGNDKQGRPHDFINNRQGPFLADLAAAGYPRESIDTVLCTHLHVDHVGWNTMLVEGEWVPTFANARYLFAREEFQHWLTQQEMERQRIVFADSVQPIQDAGLADLVNHDHRVCDEVRLVPTPGHSPGHVSVMIESEGASAIITGDIVHHPAQLALPDSIGLADQDPELAVATRKDLLESVADQPILMIGTHFCTPTAARVGRENGAYRLLLDDHGTGS